TPKQVTSRTRPGGAVRVTVANRPGDGRRALLATTVADGRRQQSMLQASAHSCSVIACQFGPPSRARNMSRSGHRRPITPKRPYKRQEEKIREREARA